MSDTIKAKDVKKGKKYAIDGRAFTAASNAERCKCIGHRGGLVCFMIRGNPRRFHAEPNDPIEVR